MSLKQSSLFIRRTFASIHSQVRPKLNPSKGRGKCFRRRGTQWGCVTSPSVQPFSECGPARQAMVLSQKFWHVCSDEEVDNLLSNQPPLMAGQNCFSEWLRVTSDPEILDYVEHCHVEFKDDPSEHSFSPATHF